MDDVAGKMSEAERKFSAKEEKDADEQEKGTKKDQRAAEFAERIHGRILDEMKQGSNEVKMKKNRQINSRPEKK